MFFVVASLATGAGRSHSVVDHAPTPGLAAAVVDAPSVAAGTERAHSAATASRAAAVGGAPSERFERRTERVLEHTFTLGTAGAGAPEPPPRPTLVQGRTSVSDKRWRTERPNADWTSAVSEYVDTAFADLDVSGRRHVDCRETVCKVEFEFETIEHAERFRDADGGLEGTELELLRRGTGIGVIAYVPRSAQTQ